MTKSTATKKRRKAIREKLAGIREKYDMQIVVRGSFPVKQVSQEDMFEEIVTAIDSLNAPKTEMSKDTLGFLGYNDPALNAKLKAEDDMCKRAEKALKFTPGWDKKNDPWFEYYKKLVKKEKDTGFTIEQFVKWFNSDDFRKKQGIWLNPAKIDKFWVTAISETDTTQHVDQEWQGEDWRNVELG